MPLQYNNNIISNVPMEACASNLCQYTEQHLDNIEHSSYITTWKSKSLTTLISHKI